MSEERVRVPIEPEAVDLREQFENDYKKALRNRDNTVISTVRLLRAAVQELLVARTDQKRKDFGQTVTAADLHVIVEKQIKLREEAAEGFEKGHRADSAAAERAEADFLRRYLPKKLYRSEIETVVDRIVADIGIDFRKVMPAAARELKGKADGRLIQEVVRAKTESR